MAFPAGFVWGAAAASYQIEGAIAEDGKGLSVWDMFVRIPGKVWNDHTGAIACDHYHRYREDVALMGKIGLKAYRFSISWPRVLPAGIGAANPKGLDFYDRLVDALLAAQVTPYVTLFHWDYPYDLFCRGGWLNPDSPAWFAEYAGAVVDKLSDRVSHWFTLNEPQCFIGLGHYEGRHAPGLTYGFPEILRMGHHVLLAHGKAVQAIRAHSKTVSQVGFAPLAEISVPVTASPADIMAARQNTFAVRPKDYWSCSWWMDPVYLGHYPEDGLAAFGNDLPPIPDGDFDIIHQPLDFCSFNIYTAKYVRAGDTGPELVPTGLEHPSTAFRWPVCPEILYWAPRFYFERYKLPIIITENGMSNIDWVALDGQVHDPQRIDYLGRHLCELERVIDEGVTVQGYFQWSLTDNFEWAQGFKERFGLIYVDFESQKRILKDSAYWYKQVIATNGASLRKMAGTA
jgi:beta-glucosidase